MSFFAIVFALIAEQCRPWSAQNPPFAAFSQYLHALEKKLNAGGHYPGLLAWILAAFLPSVVLAALQYGLSDAAPWLLLVVSAAVLYVLLRLRASLRPLHAQMQAPNLPAAAAERRELLEKLCKRTLLDCYHLVFAVIFYFAWGGMALAFLYWASYVALQTWRQHGEETADFAFFAQKILAILDYLPARLLVCLLALAGDFEGATRAARQGKKTSPGLVLAVAAGALGTRFGAQFAAEHATLRRLLGLIWRVLLLLLCFLACFLWAI